MGESDALLRGYDNDTDYLVDIARSERWMKTKLIDGAACAALLYGISDKI